jgi:uncharacterized membrane protein YphA (DoxX/SURF4 family)
MKESQHHNIFYRVFISKFTTFICRLLLGGAFLFAGIAKISGVASLIWEIKRYQILPAHLATAFGIILPDIEIIVGILLIIGLFSRIAGLFSFLLAFSFASAKINALIRGIDISICACFGPSITVLSNQSLIIDCILMVLAIQIMLNRNSILSLANRLNKK